jgi:hypothetical protein
VSFLTVSSAGIRDDRGPKIIAAILLATGNDATQLRRSSPTRFPMECWWRSEGPNGRPEGAMAG